MKNWSGNYEFRAVRCHRPTTVADVQEIVAKATRVKAAGTRHSFNDIADTPDDLISLEKMNRVVAYSGETVSVEPGIRYGDLARDLAPYGKTLANYASLPHISVGGSVATGTHGSGARNPGLASAVREIRIVKADGSLSRLYRGEGREFDGAVVALGALGIVVELTLDTVPMFEVAQTVYEGLPWKTLENEFEAVLSGAYSVSLFTHWTSDLIDQVWVKRDAGENSPAYFGAKAADGPRHPLPDLSPENCTPQRGVPGPANERLPHFRLEFTPSSGEELQTEYVLPRENAFAAMMAIDAIREKVAPLLFVTEIRTVAADGLWLSPFYGRDSVCLHFTWKPMEREVRALLPEIEERLLPLGARPHWGKLFGMSVEGLYPRMGDFRDLAGQFDPGGKFRNAYLEHTGVLR